MTTSPLVIVDCGIGNLFSIRRAVAKLGQSAEVSDDPRRIREAGRLILPGVGAFGDVMASLRAKGLVAPLREHAASGRPLLGICLGMQLLFSESLEFGRHEGLGIIPGRVTRVFDEAGSPPGWKLPHIGWNRIHPPRPDDASVWGESVFAGLAPRTFVYFVHSFAAVPEDPAAILAETAYGPARFCSAVRVGQVSACQFHPELSYLSGLRILANFLGVDAADAPALAALDKASLEGQNCFFRENIHGSRQR